MTNRTILLTLLAACLVLWSCDDTTKKTEGCGNGRVDVGEECDGGELQDATCASLGYSGGTLTCGAECTYDFSDCTTLCGNGFVEGGESCDDGNTDADDGCSSTCVVEDGWTCDDESPSACGTFCGDGTAVGDEACDGDELAGNTCESLGYYGGTLTCSSSCDFVTTGCEAAGRCGDGEIQMTYGEECDGDELGAQTCETLGYYGGALACDAGCRFAFTACEAAGRCGDGTLQAGYGEVCDWTALGGATCETQGYYGGTLDCNVDCLGYDTGNCVGFCGDGTVQTSDGEVCDGTELYGALCEDLGYGGGTLGCLGTCQLDESQCTMDRISPNIGLLKYVPAGTFQRDADPANLSTVSAFRMSQFEITRAQWTAVTGWADPSDVVHSSGTSDPVQRVSWYDAIAFCNKLSLLEGLTPVYSVPGVDFGTMVYSQIPVGDDAVWNTATANWAADGYRLPTEMEWMWAAMGADTAAPGATNTTGYLKAFAGSTGSNLIDDHAWYIFNSEDTTHPAGSKLPNELELYDLSGNVWDWVWDWFDYYPAGTLTDYHGAVPATFRGRRGSSFNFPASSCTVAYRENWGPYSRYYINGIRVVRP